MTVAAMYQKETAGATDPTTVNNNLSQYLIRALVAHNIPGDQPQGHAPKRQLLEPRSPSVVSFPRFLIRATVDGKNVVVYVDFGAASTPHDVVVYGFVESTQPPNIRYEAQVMTSALNRGK
jgi:hypothetical protein